MEVLAKMWISQARGVDACLFFINLTPKEVITDGLWHDRKD